ncbi:FAR-17a AIG1 protein [Rutstroemia sp. NJR-2017a WRK4]|nr:FAR-17a AIG1 protein [Rutstroemia sp. NJR-2017a WRK4]
MSSSTALLPKDRKKDDHKSLVFWRSLVAVYLFFSFLAILHFEFEILNERWEMIYNFSNIVYGLQTLYAIITAIWTFMHLYYPHHDNNSTFCERFFSPPRSNGNTKNKYFFSVFYYLIVTFPHIVTIIYWAILVPRSKTELSGETGEIIVGNWWYCKFYIVAKYGINSFIALFELFYLSSIKRPEAFHHVTALGALLLAYVGWAAFGHYHTEKYCYYFLDHEEIGWNYYWSCVAGFVVLGELFFIFIYAVTGIRESMTKKQADDKNTGYQRLPQ